MESEELSAGSYDGADDQAPAVSAGGGRKNRGDGKGKGKRKRRFSDQQIRCLECTFEAQTKLEPRKKLQLAGELGLQPRQVAVWFQNKRARWKSKQLEREYAALRAEYESLLSSFRSLEREKQSLGKELQKLKELLGKPPAGAGGGWDLQGDEEEEEEGKEKPGWVSTAEPPDLTLMLSSAEGERVLPEEKQPVSGLCEGSTDPLADGPALGSGCRPCRSDVGGGFSDQSCGSCSDWWEFWPLNE